MDSSSMKGGELGTLWCQEQGEGMIPLNSLGKFIARILLIWSAKKYFYAGGGGELLILNRGTGAAWVEGTLVDPGR